MRKVFFPFVLFFVVIFGWYVLRGRSISESDTPTLHVVASFYPIAEFSHNVGGEHVDVATITPPGSEPHDYEPSPQQIAEMYDADVVLVNGGGVDAWAEQLAPDLAAQGVHMVTMRDTIDVIAESDGMAIDPHFWLDPVDAQREVAAIRDAFVRVDAAHAETYTQNADRTIAELAQLDVDYANGLATCDNRTVVTSHAAFAYLAARYHFDVIAISGLSPEEEPSAGRIAEIAATAKEKNIGYIFFETLVSPRLSQTLAEEVGAQTLVFNPLEGLTTEEVAAGENYISVMQKNLVNLRTAMLCQ